MTMRPSVSLLISSLLCALCLAACGPSSAWPGGLELEEHELAAAPELEPLSFQPLRGTQEEVLARHAEERQARIVSEAEFVQGYPSLSSLGEPGDLVARIVPSPEDPMRMVAKVYRGDEEIFSADAGLPSPALPLQALWTYDGNWMLELLYADADLWQGRLYLDGALLNDQNDYQEAFGFQLLDGKPFFFFLREGKVGLSYDGQEADLGYAEIPHYQCCSGSVLNPVQAQRMVAFFARREGTWYYVEVGKFD